MRAIAVVNQKGGCGKTITSINLSAFLACEGRKVLLVDMDPQGHAGLGLLRDSAEPSATLYDVFLRETGGQQTRLRDITRSVRERLDLVPADIRLSAIPEIIAGTVGRENILSEAIDEVAGDYDYVIVDCPPNVGLLTFNALKACSEAIVPMDPSFFSLHGIGKLLETFDVLAIQTGHQVVARVLVTLYSGRTPFVKAVVDEIHNHLPGRYFETVVRYSVKLAEAASHGLSIADYCRHCAGFDDYKALTAEVLQQETPRPTRDRAPNAEGDSVRPSAPAVTAEGIVFTIEAPDAERVQLVGDFNEWAMDGNEMEPAGRIWKKVVKLPPGRYRYRYVVDGRWQSDPTNAAVEPCPYGGSNSVVVLDGSAGEQVVRS